MVNMLSFSFMFKSIRLLLMEYDFEYLFHRDHVSFQFIVIGFK
jgi:hypothetical protein